MGQPVDVFASWAGVVQAGFVFRLFFRSFNFHLFLEYFCYFNRKRRMINLVARFGGFTRNLLAFFFFKFCLQKKRLGLCW